MYVKTWMITNVVSIAPNQNITEAKRLLQEHGIRRLPVVEDDTLVGVVSLHDLKKVMPSILDSEGSNEEEYIANTTEIRTIMISSPITIEPDETLVEAARKMRQNKIDGLPVVEDGKLVGILSITDILEVFLEIMSNSRAGTRFDMKIDHASESFFKMIKAFQKQSKEILAIAQHHDFSQDQQLVTIEISGDQNDDLIDLLWSSGVTVEKITKLS